MIELNERTRRISGSRLYEILAQRDVRSIVDPFMGLPTHLNYLKRKGIAVHGSDLVEWFVRTGEGIVVNDFTILRDSEVAEIVEMLPGRIYPTDMFKAWEGVFFTEEQCVYLGVWHSNVHNLRSDGQTGLAILGLWFAFCYWLQKAHYPDEMLDIPPSELAWSYIRKTERWVCENLKRNTVKRTDAMTMLASNSADAVFFAPPGRNAAKAADARVWMWEAWWQGNPYMNIEHYYRDTVFGLCTADDQSYENAILQVLSMADNYPIIILQTNEANLARFERLAKEVRPHVDILLPESAEAYVVAHR